jgi:hypothetical protein
MMTMTHTQEIHKCSSCAREVVIDFMINGAPHHTVLAVTCMACVKDKSKLMGDVIERLDYGPSVSGPI